MLCPSCFHACLLDGDPLPKFKFSIFEGEGFLAEEEKKEKKITFSAEVSEISWLLSYCFFLWKNEFGNKLRPGLLSLGG
jgi:hypothetical protein